MSTVPTSSFLPMITSMTSDLSSMDKNNSSKSYEYTEDGKNIRYATLVGLLLSLRNMVASATVDPRSIDAFMVYFSQCRDDVIFAGIFSPCTEAIIREKFVPAMKIFNNAYYAFKRILYDNISRHMSVSSNGGNDEEPLAYALEFYTSTQSWSESFQYDEACGHKSKHAFNKAYMLYILPAIRRVFEDPSITTEMIKSIDQIVEMAPLFDAPPAVAPQETTLPEPVAPVAVADDVTTPPNNDTTATVVHVDPLADDHTDKEEVAVATEVSPSSSSSTSTSTVPVVKKGRGFIPNMHMHKSCSTPDKKALDKKGDELLHSSTTKKDSPSNDEDDQRATIALVAEFEEKEKFIPVKSMRKSASLSKKSRRLILSENVGTTNVKWAVQLPYFTDCGAFIGVNGSNKQKLVQCVVELTGITNLKLVLFVVSKEYDNDEKIFYNRMNEHPYIMYELGRSYSDQHGQKIAEAILLATQYVPISKTEDSSYICKEIYVLQSDAFVNNDDEDIYDASDDSYYSSELLSIKRREWQERLASLLVSATKNPKESKVRNIMFDKLPLFLEKTNLIYWDGDIDNFRLTMLTPYEEVAELFNELFDEKYIEY